MTTLTPADGLPHEAPPGEAATGTGPRRPRPMANAVRSAIAPGGGGVQLQHVMATVGLAVGLCLLVWVYAANNRPTAADRLVLSGVLLAPAVGLAVGGSTLLLDYLLVIVAVNRELRRLLDWGDGQYDSTSVLSLLPLLTTGLMVLVIAGRWQQVPRLMRQAAGFLVAAMAYGTALGLLQYGLPAVYACAEYVTPLIVLYYCVALRPAAAVVRRWATVLATLGVAAGIYGIYQWISPPPWDAAWVVWSGMTSSMGSPRPYQLSICSTLESRGPAAMFFAVTTAALVTLPFLRRAGGAFWATLPAAALLLTQARTGLIYLGLTLLASALFARRRGGGVNIMVGLIVAGGITAFVLGRQEQSTAIFDRVATLGNLQDDGSANGRVDIASQGITTVFSNPLGFGFGSGGNALKAANRESDGDAVGDNGYLEILSTLGLPGTLLYGAGLWLLVRQAVRNRRLPTAAEPATQLGLGLLVALGPGLLVSNLLSTAHASYVWVLLSRHLAARPTPTD